MTLKTNFNKPEKIKNFIIILFKFVFSEIINGYWMKFMPTNAVADLEDNLLCFVKQRDRNNNTWKQFNLPLIRHPRQKNTLAT